jgi:sugar phosphate isomerase/epimerase
MMKKQRREFLRKTGLAVAGLTAFPFLKSCTGIGKNRKEMQLGLCTYLWGKDWDLPTLITNCEKSGLLGVELRHHHAHGVEPHLSKDERKEVKKRFNDSPVTLVGYGPNTFFHQTDPEELKASMELTREYIILSHDTGGSGVKVQPNQFNEGVPREKTIEQIGKALNEMGKFGSDHGQQIRLEVHGPETAQLPNIAAILEVADHPNVTVCWNSNDEDLMGEGLEYNFNLVKDRFGDIAHVRELNVGDYPYQQLMDLFVDMNYKGWILLECRTEPADLVEAMREQKAVFNRMIGRT